MRIGGLQKLTLLDFPQTVSCTIFTVGCNYKCPFCHNAVFVLNDRKEEIELFNEEEIFSFLENRKGRLDGVCITGGEPLLQPDLYEFISRIKKMGYKVKLDTNGSQFSLLKRIIDEKLVDYIAMDIKNCKRRYIETIGLDIKSGQRMLDNVSKCVELIMSSDISYEFRTTVVDELHNKEDILELVQWIKGAKQYFIQNFNDSGDVISSSMHEMKYDKLKLLLDTARTVIPDTLLRGIEEM